MFCSTSSTSAKHLLLRAIFIWGNKKEKVSHDENGQFGRVGHGGHAGFGQKLLNTVQCGQVGL